MGATRVITSQIRRRPALSPTRPCPERGESFRQAVPPQVDGVGDGEPDLGLAGEAGILQARRRLSRSTTFHPSQLRRSTA